MFCEYYHLKSFFPTSINRSRPSKNLCYTICITFTEDKQD